MKQLFVSGFPLDYTEMDLAKLIGPHGDIATIKIVRDRQTGKCKGYAFVEMVTPEGADNAVDAIDGTVMQDRELTVKINEGKPANEQPVKTPRQARHNPVTKMLAPQKYKEALPREKRPRRPRI